MLRKEQGRKFQPRMSHTVPKKLKEVAKIETRKQEQTTHKPDERYLETEIRTRNREIKRTRKSLRDKKRKRREMKKPKIPLKKKYKPRTNKRSEYIIDYMSDYQEEYPYYETWSQDDELENTVCSCLCSTCGMYDIYDEWDYEDERLYGNSFKCTYCGNKCEGAQSGWMGVTSFWCSGCGYVSVVRKTN